MKSEEPIRLGLSDIPEKFSTTTELSFADDAPMLIPVSISADGSVTEDLGDDVEWLLERDIAMHDRDRGDIYPPLCPATMAMRVRLSARAVMNGVAK